MTSKIRKKNWYFCGVYRSHKGKLTPFTTRNINNIISEQILVVKTCFEFSNIALQLSLDLRASIQFDAPVISLEEIRLEINKSKLAVTQSETSTCRRPRRKRSELVLTKLQTSESSSSTFEPLLSLPVPKLVYDTHNDVEEEIVPGSVVIHKDAFASHFAIVLRIESIWAEVLFLSSKEFGRYYRRATKDELALAGFIYTKPTNLCLVTRNTNELYQRDINESYPYGLKFPEHRVQDLIKEFITG